MLLLFFDKYRLPGASASRLATYLRKLSTHSASAAIGSRWRSKRYRSPYLVRQKTSSKALGTVEVDEDAVAVSALGGEASCCASTAAKGCRQTLGIRTNGMSR